MALHTRLHVLNTMVETGLVPVFYNGDIETRKKIIDAVIENGTQPRLHHGEDGAGSRFL